MAATGVAPVPPSVHIILCSFLLIWYSGGALVLLTLITFGAARIRILFKMHAQAEEEKLLGAGKRLVVGLTWLRVMVKGYPVGS